MFRFRKTSERAKSQPGRRKGAHERRVQEASAMPRTLWGGWGLEYSSKSNSFPGSLLTLGARFRAEKRSAQFLCAYPFAGASDTQVRLKET